MPSAAVDNPSPYFVNAAFDAAFVGGISIVTFLLLWAFGASSGRSDTAIETLLVLVWVVNYPHFSATIHRLFKSRQNTMQYPFTAYVLPWIVLAGALGALHWPKTFAPYFIKLMLLWSSYHFSGQTLGISLIYARRHGIPVRGWERRALSLFIFGTYLIFLLRADILAGSYYGVDYPTVDVPPYALTLARWATWGAAGFLAAFVGSWSWRNRRIFPFIVVLPAITQYVWFVPGLQLQNFVIFVPLFHSLQYLPIALATHLGDSAADAPPTRSRFQFAVEIAKWSGLNLIGGAALFYGLPLIVSWFGVRLQIATAVVFAAIQLHHFIVDGVIWKLQNPRVASPLMANLWSYARLSA